MADESLEERVARLEAEVTALRADVASRATRPAHDDWKTTVGMFDDDPVMQEIIDETLNVRETDRQRTRP